MLLTLIIILLLIGSAVVGSIYSNFTVFYRGFGETENYNKAYYAAISALERAELVIKQRSPGYVGSGGRRNDINQNTNDEVDGPINNFSYLGSGNSTDMWRKIESRTNRIPKEGNGDIEPELAGADSTNHNKMDYENAEVFLLYYDESNDSPYSTGTITKSDLTSISGQILLPPKLKESFGGGSNNSDLDISTSIVGQTYRGRGGDDAIVDRQIRGTYVETDNISPFTIFATQITGGNNDSAIRESALNKTQGANLNFMASSRNPINPSSNAEPTIISPKESSISGHGLSWIFNSNSTNIQNLSIRLALLNLLKTKDNLIYPYLEYYMDFGGNDVSDKYYTITTIGKISDFQVELNVQKPTVKESILGNFTVIF